MARNLCAWEFPHRVDRVAEMLKGVVRPEDSHFAVAERPAIAEIRGDLCPVQISRLVTGSCRQILAAPVGRTDASNLGSH